MTVHKHLKQLVRARMKKTGESYSSARRQVIRQAPKASVDPALRWHFPGNVPATTALRVLLAHAGVRDPHSGEPFTEAMLFGIAGGIGIGVFSFYYAKECIASFFVAGRHNWQDDLGYLRNGAARFGIKPNVREGGGAKAGAAQLREALANGPCVAWVDAAHLPYLALPAHLSGGGYHVVTVYRCDDKSALIGDLTDQPIPIALDDLAVARGRIKSQKKRLLWFPAIAPAKIDLAALVRQGIADCCRGLKVSSMKAMKGNFQLSALRTWAERMHGSKDKERWEQVFAPGPNFWRGLTSIHDFIENYRTGGGLCRPLFADFLSEAAAALKDTRLRGLAERYAELGRQWSALADAALPNDVPAFREAKTLLARKAELIHSEGPAATDEVRAIWARLGELDKQAGERFPLSDAECVELRASLKPRILALYEAEVAASTALAEAAA